MAERLWGALDEGQGLWGDTQRLQEEVCTGGGQRTGEVKDHVQSECGGVRVVVILLGTGGIVLAQAPQH